MGTIKDKIEYLNETKRRIRAAIISRNVQVGENDTFRSYADKIRNIPVTAEVDVMALDATENKEYNAGEGKAYNPVTVNVTPNVSEKTINKVGVYKASDDDVDGYSKVTVDVSTNLVQKTVTSEDLPETPIPKTFKASDEGQDKVGYSQFTVDPSGTIGEMEPVTIDPDHAGEEYTYLASDKGLYGFSKVSIIIQESQGPYTVRFFDGTTLWETVTVAHKYSTATPTKGDPPAPNGKRFAGWDPMPFNVAHNMDCYAQYEDDVPAEPTSGGETSKTWEQIIANGGADLEIGTKKRIYFDDYEYDGYTLPGAMLTMEIVAKGESGTTRTWVSTSGLVSPNPNGWRYMEGNQQSKPGAHCEFMGFADTDLCRFLENLAGKIKTTGKTKNSSNIIPQGAIKRCPKWSKHFESQPPIDYRYPSEPSKYIQKDQPDGDLLMWIPSLVECSPKNDTSNGELGVHYTFTHGSVPSGAAFRDMSTVSLGFDQTTHALKNFLIKGPYKTSGSISPVAMPGMYAWYEDSSYNPYEGTDKMCSYMNSGLRIGFCT